jgi:hypothetical protein
MIVWVTFYDAASGEALEALNFNNEPIPRVGEVINLGDFSYDVHRVAWL